MECQAVLTYRYYSIRRFCASTGVTAKESLVVLAVVAWLLAFAAMLVGFLSMDRLPVVVLACVRIILEALASGVAVKNAINTAQAKTGGTLGGIFAAVIFAVAAALAVALVILPTISHDYFIVGTAELVALMLGRYSTRYLVTVTAADVLILGAGVCNREESGRNDQEGGLCGGNEGQRDDRDEERSPTQSDLMVAAAEASRATHAVCDSDMSRRRGGDGDSVDGYDGDHVDGHDGNSVDGYSGDDSENYAVGVDDNYSVGVNGSGSCSVLSAINPETI